MPDRDKRQFEWFTTRNNGQTLASDAQGGFGLYNAGAVGARFIKGATVTRMLIDLRLRAESVAQLVEVAYGIVVMNSDAVAAGGFPDADDLSDRADWLVRGRLQTIQASLSDSSQWDRVRLDIRTQRILRSEEDEVRMVFDANSSGFTLVIDAYVRLLMRMP